jgi:hypothetical protein
MVICVHENSTIFIVIILSIVELSLMRNGFYTDNEAGRQPTLNLQVRAHIN